MDHKMRPKYNFIDMIENGPAETPKDEKDRIGVDIENRRVE
jgi:hypothetical protein